MAISEKRSNVDSSVSGVEQTLESHDFIPDSRPLEAERGFEIGESRHSEC